MLTVDRLINDVLQKEGDYVNHKSDRGGPTKYGITQDTLESWRGIPVSPFDVQNLSKDEARDIYERNYYRGPRIDELPELLQPVTFDMAVNHGPRKSVKIVQTVAGKMSGKRLVLDGVIGPATVVACNIAVNVYGHEVVKRICQARAQYYRDIVANDPSQAVFLKGWVARNETFMV